MKYSKAMMIALKMKFPAIFRLLLFMESERSIDFTLMLPSMIKIADIRMVKLLFHMIGNATLRHNIRKGSIIEAIKTRSIDMINLIWKPLTIDGLLVGSGWTFLAASIINTKDRQIIQKFLNYGNIFGKKRDVIDWLEYLSLNGEIEKIDMITDGRKDYFKNFPRNPLPYAVDVKTARYLLEHGADLNCRDSSGYWLIDRAVKANDEDMIELLKEFGQMVTLHPTHQHRPATGHDDDNVRLTIVAMTD
jgi:hypothetical protein